ncbi:MAG: deoxyribose-phosphate aldolase [Flavobacteriales bacterium]|nr:deoxyribose-phosphate aldolase [Flavobacteriales bacterium]
MKKPEASLILSLLDYTTLQGTDTHSTVEQHIRILRRLAETHPDLPLPKAVCVFPVFVPYVREGLKGLPVKIATVAGDFPLGQLPAALKLEQVRYAVDQGADEVDFVASRRLILEGRNELFLEEIQQARDMCRHRTLKVILETGELKDVVLIKRAANLAIRAGADFLKTSTGRAQIHATPESVKALSEVVRDHFLATGRKVGLKPSGGIRTLADAQNLVAIVRDTCGRDWLQPDLLRLGASALLKALLPEHSPLHSGTETY